MLGEAAPATRQSEAAPATRQSEDALLLAKIAKTAKSCFDTNSQ